MADGGDFELLYVCSIYVKRSLESISSERPTATNFAGLYIWRWLTSLTTMIVEYDGALGITLCKTASRLLQNSEHRHDRIVLFLAVMFELVLYDKISVTRKEIGTSL